MTKSIRYILTLNNMSDPGTTRVISGQLGSFLDNPGEDMT